MRWSRNAAMSRRDSSPPISFYSLNPRKPQNRMLLMKKKTFAQKAVMESLSSTWHVAAIGLAISLPGIASAASTVTWANPAAVTSSAVSSTSGSADITVPTGTWAVGDVINFNGTTSSTNPFGAAATRYYVVSVTGTTLQVSTTPGGTVLNATNTTTASTMYQGVDWFTTSSWSGGTVPNDSSTIAAFPSNSNGSTNAPVVVNGNATVYGLSFTGSTNGDLLLVSGANGTGLYSLTFATDDTSTPVMSLNSASNSLIWMGGSNGNPGAGSQALKIAGTQGLILNSYQGGAITGSGTSATSTVPGKAIRITNVDWSSFSGGLQIQRGVVQVQNNGELPSSQSLTVGNDQTATNSLLAGLSMNGKTASVDGLNGNSLGRIYGSGTLTVGSSNGSGSYAGVVGMDFTGAATATNLTKAGSGTQTLTGVFAGSGSLTANAGTLVLNGATISATGNTNVASGATLEIDGTVSSVVAAGSGSAKGRIFVNSGATLTGSGTLAFTETDSGFTGLSVTGTTKPGGDGTIGALTFNGANSNRAVAAFEVNSTFTFDLGAGLTSDTIALTGGQASDIYFQGSNVINFTDLTGGSLDSGSYVLFSSDAAGAFTGFSNLSIGTGLESYSSATLTQDGNNIVLNLVAVPEPAVVMEVAFGIGLLTIFRRRKQA